MVADKMDTFFAHSDEAAFDAVASPDITLHGDLLILDNDLSGSDKVKETLKTYLDAYDYKHENIAHGADIDGSSVFHFWLHQVRSKLNVRMFSSLSACNLNAYAQYLQNS